VKYERLSNDINEAEQVFNGLPTREKTMNILSRNFMLNEQTYNFLHEKRTEAQIARAATISFHRIISPADVARAPISPNATLIKILAAFLGFLGSVTLIYIVHAIKGKVNDATTIEKKSSIPIAACVPMLKKTNQVLLYFHKLALQLEIKNLLQPKSVLTISSFDKEEGKLFNTIHLAKELVLQNKKVLIADADGSMNKKMQNVASEFQYLDLTAMPGIFTNSEILKQQLITWKQQYDYVIVKNESINHAANGLLLMKLADANLFIMHSRRTPAKMVTETELLQEEYKFNNMQFLLNGAGYNPNLLAQAFDFIKLMIQKIAKK
jgi:hypothetical protein